MSPPPTRHRHRAELQVLRGIATLELAKGLIVLGAAAALIFIVQRDNSDIGQAVLHLLHISPDHHFARVFLRWSDKLQDEKTSVLAAAASVYSGLRLIEAYGLWNARVWAEWIALLSASIYVPFEALSFARKPSWFHVGVLAVNLAIIAYMAFLRISEHRALRSEKLNRGLQA